MLIIQKFHSIHEIDPEFIPSLELLLKDDIPSFKSLIDKHDSAPEGDVFTYFLFFGPTQNTPVGFAQLCLRPLPGKKLLGWWKRIFRFWNKDHLHWKQVTWKVGDGHTGPFVFDPRFARVGKEKILALIKEYQAREDIMAQEMFQLKGEQNFQTNWNPPVSWEKDSYVLEPLLKAQKSYPEYLATINPEVGRMIKEGWKNIYKKEQIQLGEYNKVSDISYPLPLDPGILERWKKLDVQILTFEKKGIILGCLLVLKGVNGNIFFEPFPFEPAGESLVQDELYTQYALIKFFEMPEMKKCHMLKFGEKLVFDEKEDLKFFLEQGFQYKTILHSFASKLDNLPHPL
jgi:hypothetical protein